MRTAALPHLPPGASRPLGGRLRAAAVLAPALGAAGLAVLRSHPPYDGLSLVPPCPLRALTGLDCPACGGTRMTYELLHGDLAAAWSLNPFLLIVLPFLLAGLGWWWWQAMRRGRSVRVLSTRQGQVLLLAGLAWAVGRNLARLL